jgi:hypothetical protein
MGNLSLSAYVAPVVACILSRILAERFTRPQ